ncbi:MAG: NYN domain-containing protein [Planctomycetota bacterium]
MAPVNSQTVIIDGNNLLHAMHAHAPLPAVGRETLVKLIERWASQNRVVVTLVFDGPPPREGLLKQMSAQHVSVRFSAPETADDVIVRLIHDVRKPSDVRVISSDTAIRHEATHRRCTCTDSIRFVGEMFPDLASSPRSARETKRQNRNHREAGGLDSPELDKVEGPEQTEEWLKWLGLNDEATKKDNLGDDSVDGWRYG